MICTKKVQFLIQCTWGFSNSHTSRIFLNNSDFFYLFTSKRSLLKRLRYRPVTIASPLRYRSITVFRHHCPPLPFWGQRYTTLPYRYHTVTLPLLDRYLTVLPFLTVTTGYTIFSRHWTSLIVTGRSSSLLENIFGNIFYNGNLIWKINNLLFFSRKIANICTRGAFS